MDPNGQPDPWETLVTRLIGDLPMMGGAKSAPVPATPLPMVPNAAPPAMPTSAPNQISTFLAGLGKGGGAILPALGEGMKAAQGANATKSALLSRGASETDVNAALANPVLMQQLLTSIFAPKTQKMGPNEALVTAQGKEIYRNQDKFVNVPEGGTLFDPNTRQPVFGGSPKLPDLAKDYEYYKAQESASGRAPKSFEEWDLGRKRASATAISIDQKGELKFDQEVAKHQADRFNDYVKQGMTSQQMLADLNSLREIGSRVQTGKTAEITAALGPWADALGIKIEGLDDLQAYRAITSRLAPRMRVAGSGATSDFEMRTFLDALPNIGRTPGGNEIVANTLEALHRHNLAAADIASRAMSKEISTKEAEKLLREMPDPLALWKQFRGTMPSTPAPAGGSPSPSPSGRTRVWTPSTGLR